MTATEMATELGDRIKHEGEKLRALELVTLPVRKQAPKQRSKFKLITLVSLCIGVGYAIVRSVRSRADDGATFPPRVPDTTENASQQDGLRNQRLATAAR